MGDKPKILVLVGPTGIGKTAVADALADHWPVTVISADSRQVYRGLDIGTSKPSLREQKRVPHVGIDILDPHESYSAGQYARDASGWLRDLPSDRCPVVVGGTGFYVRALTDGLFREPEVDPDRRDRLRTWLDRETSLVRWAKRLDPSFFEGSRRRASRSVEIALLTGRSLSWWHRVAQGTAVIAPWIVRLTAPRPVLYRRIEQRTETMLAAGWREEVERLLENGVSPDAPAMNAVGYRDIVQARSEAWPESELRERIVRSTRRYAKRQETWFGHQLGDHPTLTLDASASPSDIALRILEFFPEGQSA